VQQRQYAGGGDPKNWQPEKNMEKKNRMYVNPIITTAAAVDIKLNYYYYI
jgi:hypothetical protein